MKPANEQDPLLSVHDSQPTGTRDNGRLLESTLSVSDSERNVVRGLLERVADGAEYIVEGARELTSEVVEGVEEVAETVKEAIVEEVQEVGEALMEELNDADQGEVFFLDMGLTRNLSILPADVVDPSTLRLTGTADTAQKLPVQEKDKKSQDDDVEKQTTDPEKAQTEAGPLPLAAYFLLVSAVTAMSSVGALLDRQHSVDPMLKTYWRMTGTWMILLPFAAYSLRKDGIPQFPADTSTVQLLTRMIMCAVGYATLCLCYVTALNYTSVGNATIFSNSQALILLAGKLLVGDPVVAAEGIGAIVAFAGAVFCARDSSEQTSAGILGDFFAVVSALGGVTYLVYAKNLRQYVPVYQFVFFNMLLASSVIISAVLITGKTMSFDREVNHGLFGWMNWQQDRLPLEITMVVVCNLFGAMGYARSMEYFDSLTISVACLMEPVIAEFIAFAMQVGFLPGWKGWLGNALVVLGTFAVINPGVLSFRRGG